MEGGWCERKFQEESDEGPVRMCWTRGTNGREQLMKTADVFRVEEEDSDWDGRDV